MSLLAEKQKEFNNALSHAMGLRKQFDGKATNPNSTTQEEVDRAFDAADVLKDQLVAIQKNEAREKALIKWADEVPAENKPSHGNPTAKEEKQKHADAEYRKAFVSFLRGEINNKGLQEAQVKAYQLDSPTGGGFGAVPMELAEQILTLAKDLVWMRVMGTVMQLPRAESLGVPSVDTDPSDDDWTNELNVGSEESTLALGQRNLKPSPVGKLLKLSKTLCRKAPNIEQIFMDRMSYKMGITEEKAFLTGTGNDQPLGIFVASTSGISTGRDVTAANATSIVSDDLINVQFNLKAVYRNRASWVLNRAVIKAIRKLKDSNNNYIWTIGGSGDSTVTGPGGGLQGTPSWLLDRPVLESEYASGTITSGLYTAVFGDLSYYWIVDALEMEIQTLIELYAATNQNGFILRKETDGMPVQEEAFSRLKQA